MRKLLVIISVCCIICIGNSFVFVSSKKSTPLTFTIPKGWPQPVYDFKNNPLTKEGFELGRRLFYDGRLSRDGNFSCASCHQQFAAFSTFDHPLSHGIDNSFTTRNAPALFNLAWQKEFMLDGGINHLDVQPLSPITAPNEMGETLENILVKLRRDALYRKQFVAAFGDTTINTQRIMKALSQFLVMLISADSKYDRVMNGKASFNLPEGLGYDIFKQKCASCHKEPFFTDYTYRNIGLDMDTTIRDYGRMRITRNVEDSLKFRVPSLRNVMVTPPYGHDGRFYTLQNVFEHYRKKTPNGGTTDSLLRKGIPLSNFEIGQLTAFLSTLTDTTFLHNKRFALPTGMTLAPAPDAEMHRK